MRYFVFTLLLFGAVGCNAESTKPEPMVQILVARQKIGAFLPIRDPEKWFALIDYPERLAPKNAIKEFEKLKDDRLNKTLDPEQPVTEDDLLSRDFPPQKRFERAVAIKVLPYDRIEPGTRVDVIFVKQMDQELSEPRVILGNRVVLANMLVVALDGVPLGNTQPQTITLVATSEQATRLAIAASVGSLRVQPVSARLKEGEPIPPPQPMVRILVAKQKIGAFHPIREPEKWFAFIDYPERLAPKNAIKEFEKLKDQRLNKKLDPEQPVTEDDLFRQPNLAAQMKPGERAVSIAVLPHDRIETGTRVDVLLGKRMDQEISELQVVLENMLLLSEDGCFPTWEEGALRTTTLAATPEQAVTLYMASRDGTLRVRPVSARLEKAEPIPPPKAD